MITYHQAFDINHCAYRIISLLVSSKDYQLEIERLSILDFYYVFPHFLADVSIPQNPIISKHKLKKIKKPYEELGNPNRLMYQLRTIHSETIRALISKGILDRSKYLKDIAKLNTSKIPDELLTHVQGNENHKSDWFTLLVKVFAEYPLHGKSGLKERVNLMEYRYDS